MRKVSKALLKKAEEAAEILLQRRVYAFPVKHSALDALGWEATPVNNMAGDYDLYNSHNRWALRLPDLYKALDVEISNRLGGSYNWSYYPVLVHERGYRWYWVIEERLNA